MVGWGKLIHLRDDRRSRVLRGDYGTGWMAGGGVNADGDVGAEGGLGEKRRLGG